MAVVNCPPNCWPHLLMLILFIQSYPNEWFIIFSSPTQDCYRVEASGKRPSQCELRTDRWSSRLDYPSYPIYILLQTFLYLLIQSYCYQTNHIAIHPILFNERCSISSSPTQDCYKNYACGKGPRPGLPNKTPQLSIPQVWWMLLNGVYPGKGQSFVIFSEDYKKGAYLQLYAIFRHLNK